MILRIIRFGFGFVTAVPLQPGRCARNLRAPYACPHFGHGRKTSARGGVFWRARMRRALSANRTSSGTLRISKIRIKCVFLSFSALRRRASEVGASTIPLVYHIAAKCLLWLLARPTENSAANTPASGLIQADSTPRDGHRSWLAHFAKSGTRNGRVGSARLRGVGCESPNPRLSPTLHLHYIKDHCREPMETQRRNSLPEFTPASLCT